MSSWVSSLFFGDMLHVALLVIFSSRKCGFTRLMRRGFMVFSNLGKEPIQVYTACIGSGLVSVSVCFIVPIFYFM